LPSASPIADPAAFEIDRARHSLRFVRLCDAPPDLVFEAWTVPEQLRLWWDAGGEPLSVCEIDLRPGGSFRFVAPSHAHMPFTGTYVDISPPSRLEFRAMDALGRVLLKDLGGRTEMIVEIVCNSAEQLEQYLRLGVANGTSRTCDNLVAFLARRA
jgi:uncharacterized protein YndB with AHSA1/START domain